MTMAQILFSDVALFLEVLEKYGVTKHLLLRLISDPAFVSAEIGNLVAHHHMNPGRKITVPIFPEKSDAELIIALHKKCVSIPEEFHSLLPQPTETSQPAQEQSTKHKELEIFFIQLFDNTNSEEALAVLSDLGLESVTVNDALASALCPSFWHYLYDRSAVVLSAKTSKNRFLSFGLTLDGGRIAHFSLDENFSSRTLFIAKRKISDIPKD